MHLRPVAYPIDVPSTTGRRIDAEGLRNTCEGMVMEGMYVVMAVEVINFLLEEFNVRGKFNSVAEEI